MRPRRRSQQASRVLGSARVGPGAASLARPGPAPNPRRRPRTGRSRLPQTPRPGQQAGRTLGPVFRTPSPGAPPVEVPPTQSTDPNKPGYIPPPETVQGATLRNDARSALTGAQTGYRDAVWRAAMGLGDPAIFAQLQRNPEFGGYKFAQDPNSTLASLGREETSGLLGIDEDRAANNSFFSGFRARDRTDLSNDIQNQRGAANTSYLDALREYASALAEAQRQYGMTMGEAGQADIDYAAGQEPEPAASKKKPRRRRGTAHHDPNRPNVAVGRGRA